MHQVVKSFIRNTNQFIRNTFSSNKDYTFCINSEIKPIIFYTNGKSIITISEKIERNIIKSENIVKLNNIYIYQTFNKRKQDADLSKVIDIKLPPLSKESLLRCILEAPLTQPEMNFNINTLKGSEVLRKLIDLSVQEKEKYFNNPSLVVIDGEISNNYWTAQNVQSKNNSNQEEENEEFKLVKKNIMELEKLFGDGLNLKLSFMLSANNLSNNSKHANLQQNNPYLTVLKKKPKAIHSNVILKNIKLEELIYSEGYLLEHILLNSYTKNKQEKVSLQQNEAYNMRELLTILPMINFKGKIVLKNNEKLQENIEYLEKQMKDCGYSRKEEHEIDDDMWYTVL